MRYHLCLQYSRCKCVPVWWGLLISASPRFMLFAGARVGDLVASIGWHCEHISNVSRLNPFIVMNKAKSWITYDRCVFMSKVEKKMSKWFCIKVELIRSWYFMFENITDWAHETIVRNSITASDRMRTGALCAALPCVLIIKSCAYATGPFSPSCLPLLLRPHVIVVRVNGLNLMKLTLTITLYVFHFISIDRLNSRLLNVRFR
jgi:hypothetical protein